MAGASKKAKRLALVRKITTFYPVFFVSNEHFGQDKCWAVAKLLPKTSTKSLSAINRASEWFGRDIPAMDES